MQRRTGVGWDSYAKDQQRIAWADALKCWIRLCWTRIEVAVEIERQERRELWVTRLQVLCMMLQFAWFAIYWVKNHTACLRANPVVFRLFSGPTILTDAHSPAWQCSRSRLYKKSQWHKRGHQDHEDHLERSRGAIIIAWEEHGIWWT